MRTTTADRALLGTATVILLFISGAISRSALAAQKNLSLGFQFQHSDVDLIDTDAFDADDPFQGMSLGVGARFHLVFDPGLSLGLRGSAGMLAPGSYVLASQIGYVLDRDALRFELTAEGGLHGFSGFGPAFTMLTTVIHDPVATVPFVGAGMSVVKTAKRGTALVVFGGRDLSEKRVTAEWRVLTAVHSGEYEVGGWFFGFAYNAVWTLDAAKAGPSAPAVVNPPKWQR